VQLWRYACVLSGFEFIVNYFLEKSVTVVEEIEEILNNDFYVYMQI